VQRVEELIRADRRIMTESVETTLWCSHALAYDILHDLLKFRKVCAWRLPRELKDRDKINRMGLSLQHLLRYADEGVDSSMLNRIVTGGELWMRHYQPESKRASVRWKLPSSSSTKKFKVTPSAGKVMLTVFGILRENC
jgi:hypothetical protein